MRVHCAAPVDLPSIEDSEVQNHRAAAHQLDRQMPWRFGDLDFGVTAN